MIRYMCFLAHLSVRRKLASYLSTLQREVILGLGALYVGIKFRFASFIPRQHASCYCSKMDYHTADQKEERNKTLPDGWPDGSALDKKEGPCAICLEETITNPVVLPCGHAFCFDCVGQYQLSSDSDGSALDTRMRGLCHLP